MCAAICPVMPWPAVATTHPAASTATPAMRAVRLTGILENEGRKGREQDGDEAEPREQQRRHHEEAQSVLVRAFLMRGRIALD